MIDRARQHSGEGIATGILRKAREGLHSISEERARIPKAGMRLGLVQIEDRT